MVPHVDSGTFFPTHFRLEGVEDDQGALIEAMDYFGRGMACAPSAATILALYAFSALRIHEILFAAAVVSAIIHIVTARPKQGSIGLSPAEDWKGARFAIPSVAVSYVVVVLFGGAFVSLDSLAFCCYFAATFILPERSQDTARLGRQFVLHPKFGTPSDDVVLGFVATWIGCCAVPLDWDRPWQIFPVASALCCAPVSVVAAPLADLIWWLYRHTFSQ
jgi:hypothetical protein